MEYHNQLMGHHHHQAYSQAPQTYAQGTYISGGNSNGGGVAMSQSPGQHQLQPQFSLLPDGSMSSEKALMWNQYLPESGYSTQAPSVCSHDSASFYQPTQQVLASAPAPPPPVQQQATPPQPAFKPHETMTVEEMPAQSVEEDNHVANWINSKDNLEMALKAIPELLKLLLDEDRIVVQESAYILNMMSRMDTPRQALILITDVVPCICDCLRNTADIETAKNLVGALYGISSNKPEGIKVICRSRESLPLLIKLLAAPLEIIVSYAITTIHNVLLESGDAVKTEMRKAGAVHHLIPLLHNQNVKFLAIVTDCLYYLIFGNQEAKMIMLELGGTQQLVALLANHNQQYPKLILNIVRCTKALSVCNNNKQGLLSMNAIPPLSAHLMASSNTSMPQTNGIGSSSISRDITQNCLITLRNLSDAASQLPGGLAPFIASLLGFLSASQESHHIEIVAAILSNLTVNEANKIAAIKSNAVPILLKHISHYSGISSNVTPQPKIVDPCMCALRHLTVRNPEVQLAQEQVRSCQGLNILTFLMRLEPNQRHWGVTKAVLGVVRNFASNPHNSEYMQQYRMIENLMTVLYQAVNHILTKTNNCANPDVDVKQDGINMYEIVEFSSASLMLLAKEHTNRIVMRDLQCIGYLINPMFYAPLLGLQRPAATILAELAMSRECAHVIEQHPGFHEFVQAHFCNQFGQLLSLSQSPMLPTNSGNVAVLESVTKIMGKLQEYKNQGLTFF